MKYNLFKLSFTFIAILFLLACESPPPASADLVILNANLYTVDKAQPHASAVAVKEGRITLVGDEALIQPTIGENTQVIDAQGQFVMPGFIEGHGHFSGVGFTALNLNFLDSKNWEEIVAMVEEKIKTAKPGEWIQGRGWHQEKWDHAPERQVHGYPYHDELSAISPDNPVILTHASGHSLFANKKAMEIAGLNKETPNPAGGEIVRGTNNEAIGVFEERAMSVIRAAHRDYLNGLSPEKRTQRWFQAIDLAQQECLTKGITSFQDAGSSFQEIERYKKMAEEGKLDLRLWAMVRHSYDKMHGQLDDFPIIDAGNHFFSSRAIKTEVDGALGAFGAWLLQPYSDKPNFTGQNTTPIEEVERIASLAVKHDMQLCVHAIGDRANRVVLDVFEKSFAKDKSKTDWRWRIEHAQHLNPDDIPRFRNMKVIASMQGIHCTSDAPFVEKRLGEQRAREGAYAWRSLLDNGVIIANGTDAPVEDVNPLPSLYASVTRKRTDTGMEFFTEQKMTREEALYSYTLGNAFAGFEEKEKGSIEVGKLGDFVILSKDLLNCADDEILDAKVLYSIVGGEVKYKR